MIKIMLAAVNSLQQGALSKCIFAAIGVMIIAAVGDDHAAYQALLILIVVDFATGFMCGYKCQAINSKKFGSTGRKLLVYFLLVITAYQMTIIDESMIFIKRGLVFYIAVTEALSIMENLHKMGVKLPRWIVDRLEVYLEGKNRVK